MFQRSSATRSTSVPYAGLPGGRQAAVGRALGMWHRERWSMAQHLALIYCYFSEWDNLWPEWYLSLSGQSVYLKTDSTTKFLEESRRLPEGFLFHPGMRRWILSSNYQPKEQVTGWRISPSVKPAVLIWDAPRRLAFKPRARFASTWYFFAWAKNFLGADCLVH